MKSNPGPNTLMRILRGRLGRAVVAALVCCTGVLAATQPPNRAAGPLPGPTLFAEGVVSTGEYESHPAFTPDGRTLYFVRSTPEFTGWTIYVTHHADGRWSMPKVAPFSGKHRDADPFVTADGKALYFISDRSPDGRPKEDMDIWVMTRAANGSWGEPRNLGAPENSTGSEWLPRLTSNGTLYFGSDRPGGLGKTDLYRARRVGETFAEPENLGPALNSAAEEYEGAIAPDESFIVLMAAGRPDDRGGGDLYFSERKDGAWTPARNLGPAINGPGLEIGPSYSPDGKTVYFSSVRRAADIPRGARPNRARNGLGDIYRIDLGALRAMLSTDEVKLDEDRDSALPDVTE
jgi:Tol biopolymer transport system component